MADAELRPWDPAEHLETHESCVTFLDVALEADDPVLVVDVLDAIARSKEMSELSDEIRKRCASLYQHPSAVGDSDFAAILEALRALGLSIYAGPRREAAPGGADQELADVAYHTQPVSD